MRGNADVSAGQRIVRLLFMAGMIVVAYLTLSLFDRAAHADTGVVGQISEAKSVTSAKKVVADSGKVVSTRKAAPKVSAPKVPVPKVSAPKVAERKIASAKTSARAAVSVPSKLVKARAGKINTTKVSKAVRAVRDVPAATRLPATANLPEPASRPKLPALPQLSAPPRVELPVLAERPAVPELAAVPGLPAVPEPPRAELPALPAAELPVLSGRTQVQADAVPPGLSALPSLPLAAASAVALRAPMLPSVIDPTAASEPGDFRLDPSASPAPSVPARPSRPDDQSTTGHARDSAAGSAPAMATVTSVWRPEVLAAGRHTPADLMARGRTVRYSGPPS